MAIILAIAVEKNNDKMAHAPKLTEIDNWLHYTVILFSKRTRDDAPGKEHINMKIYYGSTYITQFASLE